MLPVLCAVGFVTCSENVKLTERAQRVEFVSHQFLGEHSDRCKKLDTFRVTAKSTELSGEDRYSILEVKSLNEGARLDATHLRPWPEEEFNCDKSGAPDPDSTRTCERREVTAYECLMGRPPR